MKINTNKVVVMAYELDVDGKIVDKASRELPFDYIQGTNMLIPKLEAELEGKEAGDSFECTIPPEEAYGEYSLNLVFDVPKDSFKADGKLREDLLQVGRYIPMFNQRGEVCNGMIVEIKEDKVTMDFNAPMAGKTLHFTGTVISVREATEKELAEGLHGEFLPKEGGCHCGGKCHHGEGEKGCGGGCHGDGGEDCKCGCQEGDGKSCDCGPECTCGCQEGEPCTCGCQDGGGKSCNCGPECTCGCQEGEPCTCGCQEGGGKSCDCGPECTCGCQEGEPCTCGCQEGGGKCCDCGPECTCGCQEGEPCTCGGECKCGCQD